MACRILRAIEGLNHGTKVRAHSGKGQTKGREREEIKSNLAGPSAQSRHERAAKLFFTAAAAVYPNRSLNDHISGSAMSIGGCHFGFINQWWHCSNGSTVKLLACLLSLQCPCLECVCRMITIERLRQDFGYSYHCGSSSSTWMHL